MKGVAVIKAVLSVSFFAISSRIAIADALALSPYWTTASQAILVGASGIALLAARTLSGGVLLGPKRLTLFHKALFIFFAFALLSQLLSPFFDDDGLYMLVNLLADASFAVGSVALATSTTDESELFRAASLGFTAGAVALSFYVLTTADLNSVDLVRHQRLGSGDVGTVAHGNLLALTCALALAFNLTTRITRLPIDVPVRMLVAAPLFAVIAFSLSKATIIGILGAGVAYALLARRLLFLAIFLSVVATVALVYWDIVLASVVTYIEGRGAYTAETLTGRTEIWDAALSWLERRPQYLLLGNGYDAFPIYSEQFLRGRLYSAHNDLLNVLWSTGILGIVLLFVPLALLLYRTVRILARLPHGATSRPLLNCAVLVAMFMIARGAVEANVGYSGISFHIYIFILSITATAVYRTQRQGVLRA